MSSTKTASGFWTKASSHCTGMLDRMERYAALTIPKVCLPENFDEKNLDQSHDYQSIGAQAVNHVVNKLMLALFAPSRPFIKLVLGKKMLDQALKAGLSEVQVNEVLAVGERDAIKELDTRAQRPKLYQVLRHLVVTGNVLLVLGKKGMRVMGVRYFRVKRDMEGNVVKLCIREQVEFDELDPDVQALLANRYSSDTKVSHYRYICREPDGYYRMTQWVNEYQLPKKFSGRWSEDNMPYRVLVWDLADEADYGTGLVEDYVGDLEALSTLSEAVVEGAEQACELRWLVDPAGMTSVDDMTNSSNGDVLPGRPSDLAPSQAANAQGIEVAMRVTDTYERRVSRGFLMGSAVIRDAERVTQEEVRLTANELETAYGGVYSTLAASLQLPVARWLFNAVGMPLAGTDIKITIVTGLDALSRNGDLENFRLAMGDLATMATLPDDLKYRFKYGDIATFIGQGRGVAINKFLLNDNEVGQKRQAEQAQRTAETVTTEAGVASAQANAQAQAQPQGQQ